MARALTPAIVDELTKGLIYPAFFVRIEFLSGPQYLWSGIGPITWNGQTWQGVGWLGEITPMTEDTSIEAVGCTLGLSGIPSSLAGQVLTECRQGKPVEVWFGCLTEAGVPIVDPYKALAGRMDVPTIEDGAETCTASITVEGRLIDLNRSRERRYTHEDQQLDYGKPVAIASIVRSANVVTVTTVTPHLIDLAGQKAIMEKVLDATFNGAFIIATIPTANTFTYPQTAANASSSGGTATVPDLGFEYVPMVQDWNGIWGKGSGGGLPVGGGPPGPHGPPPPVGGRRPVVE